MKPLPLLVIKFFNPIKRKKYDTVCLSYTDKRDCGVSQRANIPMDIDKVFLFFLNKNLTD